VGQYKTGLWGKLIRIGNFIIAVCSIHPTGSSDCPSATSPTLQPETAIRPRHLDHYQQIITLAPKAASGYAGLGVMLMRQ